MCVYPFLAANTKRIKLQPGNSGNTAINLTYEKPNPPLAKKKSGPMEHDSIQFGTLF